MIVSLSKIFINAIFQEVLNVTLLVEMEFLIMLLSIILLSLTTIMKFAMKELLEMMSDVKPHAQSFIFITLVLFQEQLVPQNVETVSMIQVYHLYLQLLVSPMKCANTQHLQLCMIDLNTCS